MDCLEAQDGYVVTALQIFDFCGVECTGFLSVDSLMDKFASAEVNNTSEYKHLRNIMDPGETNPQIDVTSLAEALRKFSETQKGKVDLEDSFNLKSGLPQDSDSGISSDGFQLVEELQCELREKAQLSRQLREQLYHMEQQNEELTSERDTLNTHIYLLREDKQKVVELNKEYEETCARLISIENDFGFSQRNLEIARKNSKLLQESVDELQQDIQSLKEQLVQSKDECHRINEMYASRQSTLLNENETLKSSHAEITSKFHDQQVVLKQLLQEKTVLENELKDIMSKSLDSPVRLDQTIDISYTDEQMLSTLDSLTVDSRFGQQHLLEDSFTMALNSPDGRSTNMSLFDEIRLSFYKSPCTLYDDKESSQTIEGSNNNHSECKECAKDVTKCLQCDKLQLDIERLKLHNATKNLVTTTIETQTNDNSLNSTDACNECDKLKLYITKIEDELTQTTLNKHTMFIETLTDKQSLNNTNACNECDKLKLYNAKIEDELKISTQIKDTISIDTQTIEDIQNKNAYNKYTNTDTANCLKCDNLNLYIGKLEKSLEQFEKQSVDSLKTSIETQTIDSLKTSVETQTKKILKNNCIECGNTKSVPNKFNNYQQTDIIVPENCLACNELKLQIVKLEKDTKYHDEAVNKTNKAVKNDSCAKCVKLNTYIEGLVQELQSTTLALNESLHFDKDKLNLSETEKCLECENLKEYVAKLENDLKKSDKVIAKMERNINIYEGNLESLELHLSEGREKNDTLQNVIEYLKYKLVSLETALEDQKVYLNNIACDNCIAETQTECVQSSVSTQADQPCGECQKREETAPRKVTNFVWEATKSLFQIFAVLCFGMALLYVYNLSQQSNAGRYCRRGTPWKWFNIQDLLDLALRIEYVGEVPM